MQIKGQFLVGCSHKQDQEKIFTKQHKVKKYGSMDNIYQP